MSRDQCVSCGKEFEFRPHDCEESKMKFKKGDKVRCKMSYGYQFTKDRIYAVDNEDSSFLNVIADDRGLPNGMHPDYFELVQVGEPISELQRLVDEANRGEKAKQTLAEKYPGQSEGRNQHTWGEWVEVKSKYEANEYRIKPKPAPKLRLEPEGWDVEIKGDKVSVGCQEFDKKSLRDTLVCCTIGAFRPANEDFVAGRRGVSYKTYLLSWESADKLLKFLEEAGK